MRGAWIEIVAACERTERGGRAPMRGAWIEITTRASGGLLS